MMDEKEREAIAALPYVPFMEKLHIEVDHLTPDRVELHLDLEDDMKNPYGMAHGGVLFTISDCCAGLTARTDGRRYVTMDSHIHFLRSCMSGRLKAVSQVIKRGRSSCVVEVRVTGEEGEEFTCATFTMFCLNA